jgi:hypothetical protein
MACVQQNIDKPRILQADALFPWFPPPPTKPVNEFYKKGYQEKSSASTGGGENFCLEIQPTSR